MERWKPIDNWSGYFISSYGRAASIRTHSGRVHPKNFKYLRQHTRNGYLSFNLSGNGARRAGIIHLLVLSHFKSKRSNGLVCRHLDGDKLNNHIENLEWGTHADNTADDVLNGARNPLSGFDHWNSKFSENELLKILEMSRRGFSQGHIATLMGCTQTTISRIILGRTYHKELETLRGQ